MPDKKKGNSKQQNQPRKSVKKKKTTSTPVKVKAVVKDAVRAEVKKELERVKDMPFYKKGEELIKLINANFDFKANSGQTNGFAFNTNAFAIFVQCWVDRIVMMTSISVGANAVSPSELALFCWLAAILHIRRVGQLTGNTTQLIPSFAEDIQIPVPLAAYLAYLGKYIHMDQNFVTTYDLPSGFMNALLNFGELDPAKAYPFPVYNAGLLYDKMVVAGNGELAATRVWTPITVIQWCTTRLYVVANQLKALNIATVPSQSIHRYAPGIEAYTCRGIDQITGAVIPNRVFTLVTPVDFELSTIFSLGRNRVVQQTWKSAPISSPMFSPSFRYGTMTTEHYLMSGCMFLLMQQPEFRPGRIKKVYRLGKSKISTFAWSVKYITGTQFKTLFAANYQQLQEQLPNFSDTISVTEGFRQAYVMHALSALHLHHRCESNSPTTQLALRVQGTTAHAATAFYNEGIADAISLPSAVVEFIESLGVVITDGSMVFPWLQNPPNSNFNTWADPAFAGNLIEMSWKGMNYANGSLEFYPFPWQGSTALKPNVSTGIFKWDSIYQAAYEDFVNFVYPIQHPQTSVSNFAEVWKAMTGTQIYNNIALTMVHSGRLKTIRFGEAYQMLSTASAQSLRRVNIYPEVAELSAPAPSESESGKLGSIIATPPLFVNAPIVQYVGSSIALNRSEALQATILPSSLSTIDLAGATSTFLCKMTATNSYLLLEEAVQRVTQAGLNNTTMTLGLPGNSTALKALPGGEVVPMKAKDNAEGPSAWDATIHEVGSRLIPPAVGTAASVACDFIPVIGPLISGMCGAGAAAIASAFTSRGSVTAQHLTESSSTDPYKNQISSAASGVYKLGSALKAAPAAIDSAKEIVTKFAVASAAGIDYRRLAIT